MSQPEIPSEQSAFAAAYAMAEEQAKNRVSKPGVKTKPSQRPYTAYSDPVREYRRKISDLEALRMDANWLGQQWSEAIEGEVVNPKLQRSVRHDWRPVQNALTGDVFSETDGASILMALMQGLDIRDSGITRSQDNYLRGMESKGWFQQLRADGYITDSGRYSGALYGIVVVGDIMDLTPGMRLNLHGHLRNTAASSGPHTRLRLDNVIIGWLRTLSKQPQ